MRREHFLLTRQSPLRFSTCPRASRTFVWEVCCVKEEMFLPARMNQLDTKPWHSARRKGVRRTMEIHVLPVESLVYVTSYSPFRGLRGTIRTVHTIAPDLDEPFCFYLIALEGARVREPVWFEYDEVELIAPPLVAL
jgi:hypothetical protein